MAQDRAKSRVSTRWGLILAGRLAFMALILAFVTIFVRHRTWVDQVLRYLFAVLG